MYKRKLELTEVLKVSSFFLLGPRQTGKSTLLRETFPNALYIDLLDAATFRELTSFPEKLKDRVRPQDEILIIDEIQKIPELTNTVQSLLDKNRKLRTILTGSSARKLKRQETNLLGGRAIAVYLHPLMACELDFKRDLERMNYGGLPSILDSKKPEILLDAYIGLYLKEEIQAEGFTRQIGNFGRVLEVASQLNGQQINYTKVGNDAQVPARTVRDYFQIFKDTLIGHVLEPYQKTSMRKPVATAKFYFFDLGMARILKRQGLIQTRSQDFGEALEHLIFLEIRSYIDYSLSRAKLWYWRSQSQYEVDFLIEDLSTKRCIAIEVKGTGRVSLQDLKGLKALSEEVKLYKKILVCNEESEKRIDGVEILPFSVFLQRLWLKKYL